MSKRNSQPRSRVPAKKQEENNNVIAVYQPPRQSPEPSGATTRWADPADDFQARIISILQDIEKAERHRARALMSALFERLAESDPITRAACKPRILISLGLPASTYREMLRSAQQSLRLRARSSDSVSYAVRDGRICRLEYDPVSGRELALPLCNFDARIVQETVLDEGAGQSERAYVLEGTLASGRQLPRLQISTAEYESMRWLSDRWGVRARAQAGPAQREQLREAILQLSHDCLTRTVYAHTGWREHDGSHIYIHAAGALGAPDAAVELDPALARYRLPASTDRAREGMSASLRLLDLGASDDSGVYATLWAAMYLAPLAPLVPLDFVIWVYGPTGALKSTLLALVLSHYGAFERTTLLANWQSTGNALEKLLFLGKDIPVVVDDFAPPVNARESGELEDKAARIVRSVGNRAGRGRLQGDASLQQVHPPRGLLLVSGEQLPSGQSILARILPVELRRGDVDLARLSAAQQARDLLPHALSGYLLWVAARWDELSRTLPERWQAHRNALGSQTYLRLPEIYAGLAVARDLVLDYAIDLNVLTPHRAEVLRRSAQDGWVNLASRHGARIDRERPTIQFLESLNEQLLTGVIYMYRTDEHVPDDENGSGLIGWEDDKYYYLLPKIAYQRAASYSKRGGIDLNIKPAALFKQLFEEGFLDVDPEGERITMIKWVKGSSHRVLRLGKLAVSLAIGDGTMPGADKQAALKPGNPLLARLAREALAGAQARTDK